MSLYFKGEAQNLSDILEARELRAQYQEYLINEHKMTVVSYKLNTPGPIKYSSLIKKIFDEGLNSLIKRLEDIEISPIHEKVWYKNSGPEYFGVFDVPPKLLKRLTVQIEENHLLGRLFDFDIISPSGKQISREELEIEPRKCLICDKNAFECGRSREHGVEELISKIEKMALDFFA